LPLSEILFGIQLIEILQLFFAPEHNWLFISITFLGNDTLLAGLGAVVYWCLDKSRGRLVTYVLFFGAYLNFFLKVLVVWPRPPVELRIVEKNDTSYGFPSGHAQDSTTFWAWTSLTFRRRFLGVLGIAIVSGVGISRVYLGLHYPAQVIGGYAVGLGVASVGTIVVRYFKPQNRNKSIWLLFTIAILAPLAAGVALGVGGQMNLSRIGGYLLGFWLGTLAETRYVRFTTEVTRAQRAVRILVGAAVTGFLILALSESLPGTNFISSFVSALIQGSTVALVVPLLFAIIERGRAAKS